MRNIYIFPFYFCVMGFILQPFLKLKILYNLTVLVGLPAPRFFHLLFYSYDYNMHVEGLLPDYLCLVTLLS